MILNEFKSYSRNDTFWLKYAIYAYVVIAWWTMISLQCLHISLGLNCWCDCTPHSPRWLKNGAVHRSGLSFLSNSRSLLLFVTESKAQSAVEVNLDDLSSQLILKANGLPFPTVSDYQ